MNALLVIVHLSTVLISSCTCKGLGVGVGGINAV